MAERSARLNIRIPPELLERLKAAAEEDHRTVTLAAEMGIVLYCEKVEREAKKDAA